ncbi:MAG: TRAP transporter large permease [Candidatus Competibacteraceae bacterium]|nr:TRAP transporter large permease [Candidatus Competibacteraceae bacterium]MCB1804838.1 TRAP transporter large permease [Candidatus Competibacteraceae bacterium]MCB1813794.1 TRAP transporter large permease [Candidatus Competibacteraceae bacterium]
MLGASIAILLLCVLLVLRVPMLVAIASASLLNFHLSGAWPLTLPQTMMSGMSRFVLVALPLFVLAGGLMNAGGISARLFEFARATVGWLRGGLAHVNVVTSMFFGGMIGSSTADLAGTGSIVIPAMKKNGYPADFSAAVTASSAGIGPMIPPSSPMILYSAVTGTSLGALFLAGLIPGILLGLTQMAIVAWLARRRGWKPFAPFAVAELARCTRRALLSFGLPIIIVGGLVLGVFTPTEAGAFAVVYALFLATVVYRRLSLRELYRVLVNSVQLTGELLVIVSLSFALGAGLTNAHVPEALVHIIDFVAIGDSEYLRILGLVVLAIIAGMVLDPLIPVLLPIILPTLVLYQIDLVHFGVLMVIAVVVGQVTPPMAIALFIAGRIAEVDQMKVFRANMPFLVGILVFMLIIIAVPEIATWLPSIMRD